MIRAAILSMCLAVAGSSTAVAQVTLEHKVPEGSKYRLAVETKVAQKLTIAGMEIDTRSDSHGVTLVTVGKRDAAGNVTAEHQVESLQVTIGIPGNDYQFDSANPDNRGTSALEVVRDMHKALAKRLTKVTYDSSARVEKVESDLVILGSTPEEVKNLVKDELNPEHLKRTSNDELDQVKTESVKPGDTWQRTNTANFGSGQMMTFKTEFTYVGPTENDGRQLEKITNKVLEVDFGLQNSPLPLTVKDSKLSATESEGTILFDRERGQIVESVSKIRITGELTFTVNNNDLPAKLDLKLDTSQFLKP
jgi:hypothetical protein